ncbi:hypothetical protein D3C76_1515650 [compost metagenome]
MVTQRVIYRFELVQIHKQDPDALFTGMPVKKTVHFIPVRKSGDRIQVSHLLQEIPVKE